MTWTTLPATGCDRAKTASIPTRTSGSTTPMRITNAPNWTDVVLRATKNVGSRETTSKSGWATASAVSAKKCSALAAVIWVACSYALTTPASKTDRARAPDASVQRGSWDEIVPQSTNDGQCQQCPPRRGHREDSPNANAAEDSHIQSSQQERHRKGVGDPCPPGQAGFGEGAGCHGASSNKRERAVRARKACSPCCPEQPSNVSVGRSSRTPGGLGAQVSLGRRIEPKGRNGGADEIRTRDLWRDRPAF